MLFRRTVMALRSHFTGQRSAWARRRQQRPVPLRLEKLEPRLVPTLTNPVQAAVFADSIGVNTHFLQEDPGSVYLNNYSQLKADLLDLGIHHIRDSNNPNADVAGSPAVNDINDLAAAGIKTQVVTSPLVPASTTLNELSLNAGAVEGVEGLNEPDGSETPQQVYDYQQSLYNTLKSSMTFANIPVLAPSLYTQTMATQLDPSSSYPIQNYSDFGNAHIYPSPADTPENDGAVNYELNDVARVDVPNKPTQVTETVGTTFYNPIIDGIYTPRLLMDLYQQEGSVRTYYYELINDGSGGGWLFESYMGDGGVIPTPTGYDFEHLIGPPQTGLPQGGLLYDPGSSFTPTALDYAFTGGDTTKLNSMLFQKIDGTYELALWRADIAGTQNALTHEWTYNVVLPSSATVTFNNFVPTAVTGYTDLDDPVMTTMNSQQVQWQAGSNSVSVQIGDKVVFLQLNGAAPPILPLAVSTAAPASSTTTIPKVASLPIPTRAGPTPTQPAPTIASTSADGTAASAFAPLGMLSTLVAWEERLATLALDAWQERLDTLDVIFQASPLWETLAGRLPPVFSWELSLFRSAAEPADAGPAWPLGISSAD